jgi:anti-sigma-K factor RskA
MQEQKQAKVKLFDWQVKCTQNERDAKVDVVRSPLAIESIVARLAAVSVIVYSIQSGVTPYAAGLEASGSDLTTSFSTL